MPGGKRRLKQLFVGRTQTGANGTAITKILTGSVGISVSGQVVAAGNFNACFITEATIANLSACAMIIGNVEGLSACLIYRGILAGAGTASVVLGLSASNSSGSIDPRSAVLRYIAFDPT